MCHSAAQILTRLYAAIRLELSSSMACSYALSVKQTNSQHRIDETDRMISHTYVCDLDKQAKV